MKHMARLTAGLVAAAALIAPSALITAEAAAPTTPSTGQAKQLLKDIAGKDARLSRLSSSNALVRLSEGYRTPLLANIGDAQGSLDDLRASVVADSTLDTRALRKELRSFRVENFRIVINVLRQAEGIDETGAADPGTLAAVETAALEIDATSTKAEIRAVRDQIKAAQDETDEDEADAEVDTEVEVD